MKRIICMLLALGMLMCSGLSVLADNLDFMTKTYKSMNAEMEISFDLRKPLEILDVVNEFGYSEIGDIKELVSSIFESVITMDMSAVMSEDYSSMQAAVKMNSNIPFKLNDDFGGNVYFNASSWIDMDLNADTPKYNIISKTPFSNKYMIIDIFEEGEDIFDVSQTITSLLNKDTVEKIQTSTLKSIEENAQIDVNGNTVKIVFDDNGAKKYLFDIIEIIFTLDEYNEIFAELTGSNEEIIQVLAMAETFISGIKLFDSIELTYVLDNNGYISEENAVINLNLNVYDIMSAIGSEDEYITKENSNICLAINLNAKYTDVNKDIKIEFPELNDENSINLNDMSRIESEIVPEAEGYENYVSPYIYFSCEGYPLIQNDVVYFPFRPAMQSIDENLEINADKGIITVNLDDNILKIQENTYSAEYQGQSVSLDNKLFERNGTLYITDEFMLEVLGYKMTDMMVFSYDDIETSYSFEKQ